LKKELIEWVVCGIIALIIVVTARYYLVSPTIVKQASMYPTLENNERLLLNRTFRITKHKPKVGDIVTFQAPSSDYTGGIVDQSNPVGKYETDPGSRLGKVLFLDLNLQKLVTLKES